jgi:hypothetical protein
MDDRGREFWRRVMGLLPDGREMERSRGRSRPIPATVDEETGEVRGDVGGWNAY